jgi:hypothetical protein
MLGQFFHVALHVYTQAPLNPKPTQILDGMSVTS